MWFDVCFPLCAVDCNQKDGKIYFDGCDSQCFFASHDPEYCRHVDVGGIEASATEWVQAVLKGRDRCEAGPTAGPHGLYLNKVVYPSPYLFPEGHV